MYQSFSRNWKLLQFSTISQGFLRFLLFNWGQSESDFCVLLLNWLLLCSNPGALEKRNQGREMNAHQQQNTFHSNHIYVCYIKNQVRNREKKMLILYLCTPKIKKYIGNHSNWLSSTCFHQFFFFFFHFFVFCFPRSHFLLEGSKQAAKACLLSE